MQTKITTFSTSSRFYYVKSFVKTVLLFIVITIVLVGCCLPTYIFRYFLAKIAIKFKKDFGQILTAAGTIMNQKRLNAVLTFYVEGNLDVESMRIFFSEKVLKLKNSDGKLKYPELQQFLVKWYGFYFWKWDRKFDIKNHIRVYKASEHATHEDLRKYLEQTPFVCDRSPWDFLLLENTHPLPNHVKKRGKVSVVILRTHHTMFDGYSTLMLLYTTMAGLKFSNPNQEQFQANIILRFLQAFQALLRRGFILQFDQDLFHDTNAWHLRQKETNYEPQYGNSTSDLIPLKLIKEIRKKHEVCMTSVLISCIAAAVRKMMIARNVEVPPQMTINQPYPLKNHPDKLRNHFVMGDMTVPVGIADPGERLKASRESVVEAKRGVVQLISRILTQVFGHLPEYRRARSIMDVKYYTFNLSNLPTPPDPLTLFGRNVLHFNFVNGITNGNSSFLICCIGYGENMQLIIQANEDVIPQVDIKELISNIQEELEILKDTPKFGLSEV